jgi:hypothetical protein
MSTRVSTQCAVKSIRLSCALVRCSCILEVSRYDAHNRRVEYDLEILLVTQLRLLIAYEGRHVRLF